MNTEKLRRLLDRLNENLYEKEQAMALSFLTAVAGESIFFLGPPGVAKSMVARRLGAAFRGGTSFEYLMSRFSTPDEIFGPVSISRLKDDDRYERMTRGYLPEATVVFLDEIWKAGPGIQNALLTVLNEKIFRNGTQTMRLPLQLTVAASNELPAEGEGLEALWDRFLVRYPMGGIRRTDLFDRMLTDGPSPAFCLPEEEKLTAEQLEQWRESARQVEITATAFSFIHKVRNALLSFRKEEGRAGQETALYVSDRRWKKMAMLLRTSAWLHGASAVRLADLPLTGYCLWEEPGQLGDIRRMVDDTLAEVIGEHVDLPLLAERLRMVRDAAFGTTERKPATESHKFKTVKSFFYRLDHRTLSRPILIYISEYEQLNDRQDTPFILVDDRRKTGAQLLRLYQRSRYPSVFPKDLLDVRIVPGGLRVNGTDYPLMCEEGHTPATATKQETAVVTTLPPDLFERMSVQIEEAGKRLAELKAAENEAAEGHLFLNNGERKALDMAFRKAENELERLRHEWNELTAAHGTRT